jgi:hypothetical protein
MLKVNCAQLAEDRRTLGEKLRVPPRSGSWAVSALGSVSNRHFLARSLSSQAVPSSLHVGAGKNGDATGDMAKIRFAVRGEPV